MRRMRRFLSLTAALVLLAALVLSVASCGTPSFSSQTQASLSDALDKVMTDNSVPGVIAHVSVQGQGDWVTTKGVGDVASGEPMKTEDQFRIASITKSFTADMVLILVDRGKLQLDDTIDKYVPNVPNGDKITVRMLLNHTSGIRDDDPQGILREGMEDTLRQWDPWEVFQAYTGGQVQGQPGEKHVYSNAGYVLLGIMLQNVSGKSVQQLLEETITGPLSMPDSYFPDGPEIVGPHAHGYDGDQDVTVQNMSWDFTAGAMVSTEGDLTTWAKAFAEGRLISAAMRAEQQQWVEVPGGHGEVLYGLGMENSFGWLGHNGGDVGWLSDMYYLPDEQATIVVLLNKLSADGSDLLAGQQAFAGLSDVMVPGLIPDWYKAAIGL